MAKKDSVWFRGKFQRKNNRNGRKVNRDGKGTEPEKHRR